MEDEIRVAIRTDADVVTARQEARTLGAGIGFTSTDLTLLATAISELARNTIEHGRGGSVRLRTVVNGVRKGLRLDFVDNGPGIANVELAMQDGYTTGNGLGLGLPGTRRLVDDFELDTTPGAGTRIRMVKWTRA